MDRTNFERLYTSGELNVPKAALRTVTARELQLKDIPPVRFIVDGLIPAGLSILASPPKYGKSCACPSRPGNAFSAAQRTAAAACISPSRTASGV